MYVTATVTAGIAALDRAALAAASATGLVPVFGTCAGTDRAHQRVVGGARLFALMDIGVERNAYGRQVDSFEADITINGIDHPVRGAVHPRPAHHRRG